MENNNRQGCRWIEEYRKYLQNHIAEGKKFLKNDVGILEKSDIAQTKSFTRGKHTGFVYAFDKFNELSTSESIEPCATSSEIGFAEWIIKEYQPNFAILGKGVSNWTYKGLEAGKEFYTTEQLYEIYKSQTPSPTGDRDCEELK